MNTSLAIYDALLQARVSPDAARAVVDALEKDMTTLLATKQDFRHFEQVIEARLLAFDARLEAFDARLMGFDARLDALEWRLVVKLGGLITALFGIAGIVYTIFR